MRIKSTQEAKTAKKAMFMIERCLSVGDTGSSRSGGGGGGGEGGTPLYLP